MQTHEIIEVSLSVIRDLTGRDYGQDDSLADASVFELGIDSLSIVNLIFQLEDKLKINIPLSDLDEDVFQSVRHLALHLEALQTKVAA
jgi:acyl carrier protein